LPPQPKPQGLRLTPIAYPAPIKTISAARELVNCGLSVQAAKQAIDQFVADLDIVIDTSAMGDTARLVASLAACGIRAEVVSA
jgi:hypothetical protein